MKLIESSVSKIKQPIGPEGIFKMIEIAGRTCYKSEDKIIEESSKLFVDRMINSKHLAMLEHGTVYLKFKSDESEHRFDYRKNHYSKVFFDNKDTYYVTTNYRVLVENNWLNDLKFQCEPTEKHYKRTTYKFVCDRGVSHELVRHRVFSFAQESTRYCNYSKDKFGNELTFCVPCWVNSGNADEINMSDVKFSDVLFKTEKYYFELLEMGWTAQQARAILPNALKTEVIMTGFDEDWKHFIDLRSKGTTGAPHPDMKKLADIIAKDFENGVEL